MEHTNQTRRLASALAGALLATGALTGVAVAAAPPAQARAPLRAGPAWPDALLRAPFPGLPRGRSKAQPQLPPVLRHAPGPLI